MRCVHGSIVARSNPVEELRPMLLWLLTEQSVCAREKLDVFAKALKSPYGYMTLEVRAIRFGEMYIHATAF